MQKQKNGLIFFVVVITLVFIVGNLQGIFYETTKDSLGGIILDKGLFVADQKPELTIENRQLNTTDSHSYKYQYAFDKSLFGDRLLKGRVPVRPNWYLLIEKPDCQYLEVQLNNQIIGKYGQSSGKANLWNGYYVMEFSEMAIMEKNNLCITMDSDYMTGVAGDIVFLNEEEYEALKYFFSFDEAIVLAASIIAFFAALILLLFIISLRKKIYNMIAYGYFVFAILALGISMFDYQIINYMSMEYLTFKKIILLSYHLSVTSIVLAVSYLLNTKVKFNMGMIGTAVMFIAAFTVPDALTFRKLYVWVNYGIILAIIQVIYILIRYRKRIPMSASLLLFGFGLSATSVIKLIFITSNLIHGNTYIDMAIINIIFVILVMFTLFNEFINLSQDGLLVEDIGQELSKYQVLSGNFYVDKKLQAVAPYSLMCDHIFKRFILGEQITELFYPEDEKNKAFLKDTLEYFFNPEYEFKDGFIALLPTEIRIGERIYFVTYFPQYKEQLFLGIQLNDITQIKQLEEQLQQKQKEMKLVINALKHKDELYFIIEKTKESIAFLDVNPINQSFKNELHTIKGNLGQFGFSELEVTIHGIETLISTKDIEEIDPWYITDQLRKALERELENINQYIGEAYLSNSVDMYTVSENQIVEIEAMIEHEHYDGATHLKNRVLNELNDLRMISFQGMFSRFNNYVDELAQSMGKNCLPLIISGDDIRVKRVKAEPLLQAFVAIIRNSLCHGIETSDIRVEKGKDSFGQLKCLFEKTDQDILVHFVDDGEGINTERVKEKIAQMGLMDHQTINTLDDDAIIDYIFMSEISAKESVDLISGRGIGLSAVRTLAASLNGNVKVKSVSGVMTEILVRLPIASLQ